MKKLTMTLLCLALAGAFALTPQTALAKIELGEFAGIVANKICSDMGTKYNYGNGACRAYLYYRLDQQYSKVQAEQSCIRNYCESDHTKPPYNPCREACRQMRTKDVTK